jgi:dTMP kinase
MTRLFITFEGPDGSGKTTQVRRLVDRLTALGHVVVTTREPGGTPVGERIRDLLLALDGEPLSPRAEALLFCAARAEHVDRVIRPALAAGHTVLCDRFSDATLAYQGYGGAVPVPQLDQLNALATGGLQPGLTLLLDLPVEAGLARRRGAPVEWTRLDAAGADYHQRVRDGYLALARQEPARWVVIDAAAKPDAVAEAIWQAVASKLSAISYQLSVDGSAGEESHRG